MKNIAGKVIKGDAIQQYFNNFDCKINYDEVVLNNELYYVKSWFIDGSGVRVKLNYVTPLKEHIDQCSIITIFARDGRHILLNNFNCVNSNLLKTELLDCLCYTESYDYSTSKDLVVIVDDLPE